MSLGVTICNIKQYDFDDKYLASYRRSLHKEYASLKLYLKKPCGKIVMKKKEYIIF